jgi:hypothetical protein
VNKPTGDYLEIDVVVVDTATLSSAPLGTTVTGTNTATGATVHTFQLGGSTEPLFPNDFFIIFPYSAALAAGTWTFTATSGLDTVVVSLGPHIGASIPLVTGVTLVPNGLTPTVSWTLPSVPLSGVTVRIFDDDTDTQFFTSGRLPATATSYTLQPGDLPGPGNYTYRILAESFSDAPVDYTRSAFYGNFSIPEPGTLAIFAFGLAGLGFMTRRRRRGAVA